VTGPFAALRPFLGPPQAPGERCELCATPVGEEHSHVVNVETRELLCACRPCHLLFTNPVAARGKYRAVPGRHLRDPGFRLGEAAWERLQIPVRMAFFFRNSKLDRVVAFYPSPAGATESLLALGAWDDLVAENPRLRELEPDVEAFLVHGGRDSAGFRCFVVPINACYELVGRVRQKWKGLSGGEEAWRSIDTFFADLESRCETS
jgi:hypothetical protein